MHKNDKLDKSKNKTTYIFMLDNGDIIWINYIQKNIINTFNSHDI